MSIERIKDLLKKKFQELDPDEERGLQFHSIEEREQTANLLKNLQAALEWILNPPAHIELIKTFEMGKAVDDRVAKDPVGSKLYEIGWDRKRPDYAGENWFMEKAHITWSRLEDKKRKEFELSWRLVGDNDTQIFFDRASEDQLFQFWFDMEVLYEEKWLAFDALFCMAGRSMKKEEYKEWAKRFKFLLPQKWNR